MNTNKILVAGLVGGIFSFFLGWLVFGILLKDMMPNNVVGLMRTDEEFVLWAMVVSSIFFGLIFSYIFVTWANISTWMSGAKAGAIIGFLITASSSTSWFAMSNIHTIQSMIVEIISNTAYSSATGAFVGWWLGRK